MQRGQGLPGWLGPLAAQKPSWSESLQQPGSAQGYRSDGIENALIKSADDANHNLEQEYGLLPSSQELILQLPCIWFWAPYWRKVVSNNLESSKSGVGVVLMVFDAGLKELLI